MMTKMHIIRETQERERERERKESNKRKVYHKRRFSIRPIRYVSREVVILGVVKVVIGSL